MLLTSLGKNSRGRSNSQTLVEMRGVFNLKYGTERHFLLKTTKTEANEKFLPAKILIFQVAKTMKIDINC